MTRKNRTIASLAFQERRAKRRFLANQEYSPKEGKVNTFWRSIVIVGIVCMTILCLAGCFLTGMGGYLFSRPAESNPAPINTVAPGATKAPVATEVAATPVPAPVSCTTPSIKASLDGSNWTEQGEFLDTVLGKRMTFTNRKVVVPSKAWNDPLTTDELKLVEQTWVKIQICVVEGQNAILFAGGLEQSLNRYENGILLSLKPGLYEFSLRNGEAVIWYPNQETFFKKDLDRIFDQIRMGNFDVKAPLAFFGVSADLLSKVPDDLVKQRNVQVVPSLDPVVK